MNERITEFIKAFSEALEAGTFVKLTLGNYKGTDEHLQKIFLRRINTRKGERMLFQYRYDMRDVVKNYDLGEARERLEKYLLSGFRNSHLFTTANDFQLDIGKRNARLNKGKPTFRQLPQKHHDRAKNHLIDPGSEYLRALGISSEDGKIRADQRDKWKQINKFVEVVDGLVERSGLKTKGEITAVDMGCGKGYLTFALYDHLVNNRGIAAAITGIDRRADLMETCESIAKACDFEGLSFHVGDIAGAEIGRPDILIALHACDTATDDALARGVAAGAKIIVAAPCCHQQVRKQLQPPAELAEILKHPVLLERTAETLTDGLRSMLLESRGYATKLFEFVATEHTPKNNMLVAVKEREADAEMANAAAELMARYGITEQRLATELSAQAISA
ncbi:MAG TPA: SAM-dependent methyltransferase [Pyrinomonadaceae bacterium]|nr:SAM-dependent methyltransferase [Pyrinomonadaceae bacterium]